MKIDFESIRDRRLFVASPLYGGQMHFHLHQSISNLMMLCQKQHIFMGQKFVYQDSLVPRARNRLAAYFLESDCTDMLMVDSDIGFRAEDALSLLQYDEPVIAGVYSRKQIDWLRIERAVKAGVYHEDLYMFGTMPVLNWSRPVYGIELERLYDGVKHVGTGFLRIRRTVFEKIIERYEHKIAFDYPGDEPQFKGKTGYDFFPCGVNDRYELGSGNRQYLSEDWFFCERVRECGMTIHFAPWVRLVHAGAYDFVNDFAAFSKVEAPVEERQELLEIVP